MRERAPFVQIFRAFHTQVYYTFNFDWRRKEWSVRKVYGKNEH